MHLLLSVPHWWLHAVRTPVDWAHDLFGPDDWAQPVSRLGPASWSVGPTLGRFGPPPWRATSYPRGVGLPTVKRLYYSLGLHLQVRVWLLALHTRIATLQNQISDRVYETHLPRLIITMLKSTWHNIMGLFCTYRMNPQFWNRQTNSGSYRAPAGRCLPPVFPSECACARCSPVV